MPSDPARVWNNHRPGCGCRVCLANDRAEEERQAEAAARRREITEAVEAVAGPLRAEVRSLARQVARVCRAAGVDPVREPVQQGPAQSRSSLWTRYPDHDPRFLSGQMTLEQVAAEYAAERQARQQPAELWRTRDGTPVMDNAPAVIGASYGPSGAPVQRSAIHLDVPDLGSEA